MNAIEYLTRFETDCLNLYNTLGNATTNPELKELYTLLADARQRHIDALAKLNKSMGNIDTDSEAIDRADHLVNICHRTLLDPDMSKAMRNDHDAFNHVMRAEEEMIRICAGMARVENKEGARTLLNWFVADEKQFMEEVEEIYDFVEKPRGYLEWGEFSNLRTL
jgi:rubrerythrin